METKLADYQNSKEYQEAGVYEEITVTIKRMGVQSYAEALMEALLTNILLSHPNSVTDYNKTHGTGAVIYTDMTLRGPKYAMTPFLVFVYN